MARHASPVMLALPERWIAEMGAAGFAADLAGMSLAKLILGVIDAHARKISGGSPDA